MADSMDGGPFDIALVGAGAISAGAYTGGVVDFMAFALDAWYAAKAAGDKNVPPHEVRLGVFCGASAGAITAALSTAYLCSDQPSIASDKESPEKQRSNKLFDSWVNRIDIKDLLQTDDLADDKAPVVSLLDSTVLNEIADSGLDVAVREQRRSYVAPEFQLLMTVTNLRGVPYGFKLNASRAASYDMMLHADYVHFTIGDSEGPPMRDRYQMRWSDFVGSSPVKDKLKISALASGAFPIGLASYTLSHTIDPQSDWYSARTWPVPTPESTNPHVCITEEPIPANWGKIGEKFSYLFQCVDGGVMDNEPFELARKQLAGANGRNERDGEKADKAVLMIDPFPSDSSFNSNYVVQPDIFRTGLSLFKALKNQARFKPEELMLAEDRNVASRYMIAPSRGGEKYAIACGSLGGFGGFLKRDFRAHDYFLARRNAQKFFRDHFVLPEENPLFAQWTEAMKEGYCVRDDGQPVLKNGQRLLPIIPLVGDATAECAPPLWPQYSAADLEQLMALANKRTKAVLTRLVDQLLEKNVFLRPMAKIIVSFKMRDIVNRLRSAVSADLKKMGLLDPSA
jgi:hypothetical protein